MILNNTHLFELFNAGPHPASMTLALARLVAQWVVFAIPVVGALLWMRGNQRTRRDLMHVVLSALIALGIAQLVGMVLPSPRPFALRLGYQYLAHVDDSGLPSDHVTLVWSIALATLGTARASWLVFPLLTVGLLIGWARVYLGVHFPLDIAAALPVAAIGVTLALILRSRFASQMNGILARYDAWERAALHRLHRH